MSKVILEMIQADVLRKVSNHLEDRGNADYQILLLQEKIIDIFKAVVIFTELTDTELHILRCMKEGLNTNQTAIRLCKANRTIRLMKQKICYKVKVDTIEQALSLYVVSGLP